MKVVFLRTLMGSIFLITVIINKCRDCSVDVKGTELKGRENPVKGFVRIFY